MRTGREIFLAALVGLVVGLAACGFHLLIDCCRHLLLVGIGGYQPSAASGEQAFWPVAADLRPNRWLLLTLPAFGALLATLAGRFAPAAGGHGTDSAIEAYHRHGGAIDASVPPVKALTAALVIGSGGSAGCEGPVTLIGAGCASQIARLLRLSTRERRILMAAGLGAGVGALFRAPLAGALFAAEVFYRGLDLEFEILIPAMVASTLAYSVFASCFGWAPLFSMPAYTFESPAKFAPYLVLALVIALGARFNILIFRQTELLFRQMRIRPWLKPVLGGLGTGLIGFFLPEILGTSYGLIQQVLLGGSSSTPEAAPVMPALLLMLFAAKVIATASTVGSGGSGGVFGPALVSGALLGAATGGILQQTMPFFQVRIGACALVGMAGFLAASIRTPLAAILMVSEITGNHGLLIPSMMVCGAAFLLCPGWTLYRSQVLDRACSPVHSAGPIPTPETGALP